MLDKGEEGHGVATILTTLVEVVIVEARLIGEEGWQHTLNTERAMHGWHIIEAALERHQQILDVVANVHQVDGEIGIERCQLLDATALETFVVGQRADIHRNILAELLS